MFRLNLYVPFFLAVLVMLVVTVAGVAYMQESTIHSTKKNVANQFSAFLGKNVKHEASVMTECIGFIHKDASVRRAFAARDKRSLYERTRSIYESLGKSIQLTHLYFILPDGTVLLRVHDYGRDLDVVKRSTFLKAQESQAQVYGLEFGIRKNYTLRIVEPWYEGEKLIGYIEMGKEIDKIFEEYTSMLGTDVFMAVKKENFLDSPDFMSRGYDQHREFGDYYIAYATRAIPDQMEKILDGEIDHTDIADRGKEYYVAKTKLSDYSQRNLGYLVFMQDVSLEHRVIYSSVAALAVMLFVLSLLFFGSGSLLIRRKETNINALTSELEEQKNELERFNVKLQNLFDLQQNFVILTDGRRLIMANRAMFDFFGYSTLHDFHQHHDCICDRFIEDDHFFHLKRVPKNELWVDTLQHLPQEKRIVAMLDAYGATHAFNISVNEFEPGNYIVALTDISDTMKKQIALIERVYHDPLTGAYSREFLQKNFRRLRASIKPLRMGVIISDIDYFKEVNDTYGHIRGDQVLQRFVDTLQSSMRPSDYLIRWGGEEFIIVMAVDSLHSLLNATEHLRMTLEQAHFPEVGHLTASFGATLMHETELLSVCIERCDRALYTAKQSGRNQVHTA